MNNSSLQLFDYGGVEVRTLMIDGDPWFVLNDLCKVLEIANPYNVASRIDQDALRKAEVIDSMGRTQETSIVNESGMYEVVIRSNGEIAKHFRRWLTNEVLPTIRKTGSFVAKPKSLEEQALEIMGALQERVAEQARELEVARPLAEQAKQFREADGYETLSDLANRVQLWAASNAPEYKVLHQHVFDLAGELNVVIRGNTVRNNQPTAQAIKAKWVKVKDVGIEHNSGSKSVKTYARLTPRGSGRIWDEALRRIQSNLPLVTPKNNKEVA